MDVAYTSHPEQTDLSHELLRGEDELVVDEPAGLLLEQGAVGVGVDCLLVLHRLVAAFAQSCCVVEVSCRHRLGKNHKGGGVKHNYHPVSRSTQ